MEDVERLRKQFVCILENSKQYTTKEIIAKLFNYDWSHRLVRQAFYKSLDYGLSTECLGRCYTTVHIMAHLCDVKDFQPIVAKYREKFREESEILLTGTNDGIFIRDFITEKSQIMFLLVRYQIITDELACEFLTRLMTPPKYGKHRRIVRIFMVAGILEKMHVAFPQSCRREWIPKFIEQMEQFYEIEKNKPGDIEHDETFDESTFIILYENVLKGLKRQLEIVGDEETEEDTIAINTIRCETFLICFQKCRANVEKKLENDTKEMVNKKEKVQEMMEKITEKEKKLMDPNDSSRKKRIEVDLKTLKRNRNVMLNELQEKTERMKIDVQKIESYKHMELVRTEFLDKADSPWLYFDLNNINLKEPSTSTAD